ncbi:hypothetical protein L3Q82_005732 [Scortum barcoo]|uniref:Uncharacterized protein n=1 Tax=Scortum barcoo TaxID=214431 RepID=A0ACB8V8E7_9TELE|nr:hypothetical protein L3Q82_005732 [Scortum barcoo]
MYCKTWIQMAEEEETREVLFPDWEGPDKTGLTIEQTSEGEIFVKKVKGESPAARSGKVYEGDQIVGATVYFDNMSSEETAELLKTLNRHKVGLKLQNKGDKSPLCSPLSTPCRSPMGTLTWEGKTRFGGSNPDIILSGDDEDYKRIYTKKIKPRLKSEDLAEGVDVRTERHSSTSSDGSTITTITTRRITTYTVDMPGGISEQLELSSPEFKGLRHESGDGSPRIRISHGSPSGNVRAEEGVFESSNVSYTGPQVSSTEAHWGSGGAQTTLISREITREGERERATGLRFKGPAFVVTGGKGQGGFEISGGSGEQGDGSIQVSETNVTVRDSTNTGSRHVTIGGLGGGEVTSADENGGSIGLSLPGKGKQILTSSKISEITISHPQAKGSGSIDVQNVRLGGGSRGIDTEVRGGRIEGPAITVGSVTSGYSSVPGKISVAGVDINLTSSKLKGEVDVTMPKTEGEIKAPEVDIQGTALNIERKGEDIKMPQTNMPSFGAKGPNASVKVPEVDIKAPEVDGGGSDIKIEGIKFKMSSKTGPTMPEGEISLKRTKIKGDVNVSIPKIEGQTPMTEVEIKGPQIDNETHIGGSDMPKIKMPSFGITGPKVDAPDVDIRHTTSEMNVKAPAVDIKGTKVQVKSPHVDIKAPQVDIKGTNGGVEITSLKIKGPKVEVADVDVNLPKAKIDGKAPEIGIKSKKISMPNVDVKGPTLKGDAAVSGPKIEGDIKTPVVDIKGTEVDIEGPKGGFEMPKFKMPSMNIKGPKVEGPDVDLNLPKANIDVKASGIDVKKAPKIDIEGPDADLKGPKVKMPTFKGPKMPDIDIKLKGPKVEGDMDVSLPKIEGDIKAPEVDIEGPDLDIEGHKGGFKMPKIKMPSFGFKGPKVEGPDADINLPKANIDVTAPDVNIKGPEVDIEGPDAKIKGPKFNMPSISGPKISMPDVDFKLKGPKLKGDVDVSAPKIEGDIKNT